MPDRRRIVRQWREGAASVLVTLVRAEGSSYRRPGAHLLIGTSGEFSGSISGGCLEAEVVRKAAWMVRNGALIERYSTLFDDTAEIPYGLGCGGIVDLLLEPVDTPQCRALLGAMEASLTGVVSVIATWLPAQGSPLRRAVFSHDGSVIFASDGLSASSVAQARTVAQRSPSVTSFLSDSQGVEEEVFVETLSAPQRLVVCGAGEDARPLVKMAALLGWRVAVADERTRLAQPDRFPEAENVLTGPISTLALHADDAVVLMTHSYEQDRSLLQQLLAPIKSGLNQQAELPGYIGLLGAAHRSSLLISEAAASLEVSIADCCERVWAPVGLDLGGDGAEAIALATVAEVQAWRQGRLGSSRRLTAERVDECLRRTGDARPAQSLCALNAEEG